MTRQQQQQQQPFKDPLSGTTQVSQYQKKHSPTQVYGGANMVVCYLSILLGFMVQGEDNNQAGH